MNKERVRFWLWAGAALLAGCCCASGLSLIWGESPETAYSMVKSRRPGCNMASTALRIRPSPGSIVVAPPAPFPGYPLFLAACFRLFGMENYRAVLYVQVAATVACCLVSALAGRLFGRHASCPSCWSSELCPSPQTTHSTALTETLFRPPIRWPFTAFAPRLADADQGFNRWLWQYRRRAGRLHSAEAGTGLLAAAVLPAMLWRTLENP